MYTIHPGSRCSDHVSVKSLIKSRLRRIAAVALVLPFLATGAMSTAVTAEAAPRPPITGPTSWGALNIAIAGIPNYRSGVATWTVTTKYGHWGVTDVSNGKIYISPNAPADKLYSVVAHEYSHALAAYNWGRNSNASDAALNRWFGGGVATARERAADCMARAQGATWTNYTSCTDAHWKNGAKTLLAGKRLP